MKFKLRIFFILSLIAVAESVNAQARKENEKNEKDILEIEQPIMAKLLKREKVDSRFGSLPGSGTIEHCSMSSSVLGQNKDFTVYLPAGYEEGTERYPVIYLLHPAGGTDDIWESMGHLPEIANDAIRSGMALPMIIVMPDASGIDEFHLGKHLGFFSVPGWDYEKYFMTELIPLIDASYRTMPDKKHRALTGASMGGAATIAYAQKYPEYFGASCSMSGILGHPEQSQMASTDKDYAESLIMNNPSAFIENVTPQQLDQLKTIRWYADCGDSDFFIEGNTEFFLAMKKQGVAMDYRMRSGVHGWYYWITGLAPILQFLSIGFAE